MTIEQLKTNYESTSDNLKSDFIEWITVCNYMDEENFDNLFRLNELNEEEFFRIIDFLWKQECFNILFLLMAHNLQRFKHPNWEFQEEVNEHTMSRVKRLNTFKDFTLPLFL